MNMEKLIIAGAGPAGVSAALYAVRSGITPLVLHKGAGALEKAAKIENYYGLPKPISGRELYENGIAQLSSLEVPVLQEELLAVEYDGDYTVHTAANTYHTRSLILATGTKRNTLSLKELKKYEGSGISYCAICDGFFYRGKEVAVLGNGVYALHEAQVLEPLASKVTILTNGKEASFSPGQHPGRNQENHQRRRRGISFLCRIGRPYPLSSVWSVCSAGHCGQHRYRKEAGTCHGKQSYRHRAGYQYRPSGALCRRRLYRRAFAGIKSSLRRRPCRDKSGKLFKNAVNSRTALLKRG